MVRRRFSVLAGGVVLALAALPGQASAGTYTVANCISDAHFRTEAFGSFATRGMTIEQKCSPKTTSGEGLIVGNKVKRGTVKRGSYAQVSLEAPPGTHFIEYRWSGQRKRTDCRYALQMWADAPGMKPIPMRNVRANEGCPKRMSAQASQVQEITYAVQGATRIVHRVVCVGSAGRKSCSTGGRNQIRTLRAEASLQDAASPAVTPRLDTPLTRGEWVSAGDQLVNYDATDNVGVRLGRVFLGGVPMGSASLPCLFADAAGELGNPHSPFRTQLPCPNHGGQVTVSTDEAAEGTQSLVVQAQDPAGNVGEAPPLTARIDRTAPSRVDATIEGGDAWRSKNEFAVAWANPDEGDRAPIAAILHKMCRAVGGDCATGERAEPGVSRLALTAPAPGEWSVSLWRRDAAGNESEQMASAPVTLRYDPDAPQLGFESVSPSDPTLVSVKATDAVSGIADAGIEMSAAGSGVWQTLPVQRTGDRVTARIDDSGLAPGVYELRTRAVDQAGNEASSNLRVDGQPMILNLPLRVVSSLQTAFGRERVVRERVRRKGRTRTVERTTIVQTQAARVLFGESAQVGGKLVAPDGTGIVGANVNVVAVSPLGTEEVVATVQTAADGAFSYVATGIANRTLRFVYAGSPGVLPTQSELAMSVPASTELRVNRRKLRNGQTVIFRGPVRTVPLPPEGKLLEMQVRQPGRWQTFKTVRSDAAGQFEVRYTFRRTSGVIDYRFRVRLPAEAGYPFTAGVSRVVTVRVTGP
jgi:hypothetical protein